MTSPSKCDLCSSCKQDPSKPRVYWDFLWLTLARRLRELGSMFEDADNWQAFAIRNGQLITAPQPSAKVAEMLIEAL